MVQWGNRQASGEHLTHNVVPLEPLRRLFFAMDTGPVRVYQTTVW
jgi:hypothetical protein